MKRSLLIWMDEEDKNDIKKFANEEGIGSMTGFLKWLLCQYKKKKQKGKT